MTFFLTDRKSCGSKIPRTDSWTPESRRIFTGLHIPPRNIHTTHKAPNNQTCWLNRRFDSHSYIFEPVPWQKLFFSKGNLMTSGLNSPVRRPYWNVTTLWFTDVLSPTLINVYLYKDTIRQEDKEVACSSPPQSSHQCTSHHSSPLCQVSWSSTFLSSFPNLKGPRLLPPPPPQDSRYCSPGYFQMH